MCILSITKEKKQQQQASARMKAYVGDMLEFKQLTRDFTAT